MAIAVCKVCRRDMYKRPSQLAKGAAYCSSRCYRASRSQFFSALLSSGLSWCGLCKTAKPFVDFYTDGGTKIARRCKECRRSNERHRRKNPILIEKFHRRYETDMTFRARELLRGIGKRCRREGLEFDITLEWLSTHLSYGRCELTGLSFNMSVSTRKATPFSPSVDRINPKRGYTKDNCRVVLLAVNIALSNWGLNVALPIMEALVKRHSPEAVA